MTVVYTKETRSIVTCNMIVWGSFFDDTAPLFFAIVIRPSSQYVHDSGGGGGGGTGKNPGIRYLI
jgi:hypothetical protein